MWRWFSINIDPETHFGGIVIGTDGGDLHRGWVWRDGEHTSIAEWRVASELEDDGVTHRRSFVTAVDKLVNTGEFFVHHEDVRRAGGEWSARELDPSVTVALTKMITRMARLLTRPSKVGVVLEPTVDGTPSTPPVIGNKAVPSVSVRGAIGELVMFVYGRQAQADLFLDTFPYNAHATASDALWAGLPVVTLRGESFVSRVSSSLLANIGLEELIAATPQEYEAIASSLARDRSRLSGLRRKLAQARKTAPLFDMDRFVAGIEAAYLQMQVRCGEKPEVASQYLRGEIPKSR